MGASETLRAPAKLNLTLEVLGRRHDGLHGLRSVMVPIDLHDEIAIAPAREFSFACDVPELASENLVLRALDALPLTSRNFSVTLHKRIPTGAGLGGGSSDAASILLAASNGLLGALSDVDYVRAARSLGSDVPFFLTQTAALVEGTGERVTALGASPAWHALIVRPPVAVSTAWAYSQLDAAPRPTRPRNDSASLAMGEALQRGDFRGVLSLMHNDFEPVISAATPQIAHALELLARAGALKPMLTGSGSCVFALFENADDLERCHRMLGSALSTSAQSEYQLYRSRVITGDAWRSAA